MDGKQNIMEFDFNLPGLSKPGSNRPQRVAEAIKNELSVLLLREVADPRLAGVSFSKVMIAPDLKQAKVYFVLPPGEDSEPVLLALKKAKGFFRSHLAKSINLRYTPDLSFYFDNLNDELLKMDKLFQEIAQDEE